MAFEFETIRDARAWDAFVMSRPAYSITHSRAWGELKESFGWRPRRFVGYDDGRAQGGAQILGRAVPLVGGELWYAPRGFLVDYGDRDALAALTAGVRAAAREARAVAVKIEPLVAADADLTSLAALGYRATRRHVQPLTTLTLDLRRGEDELLAGMERQTRYNVNLATRKGVTVRAGIAPEDLNAFYVLLEATTNRKHFLVHNLAYYEKALALFRDTSTVLLAEYEGELLAAAFVLGFGRYAYYAYAASAAAKRELKATNLLAWEAVRWAKSRGYEVFDFWGIPREPAPANPLYGVYTFKKGYGGVEVRYAPAYDLVLRPAAYGLLNAGLAAQAAFRNLRARGTVHDPMADS